MESSLIDNLSSLLGFILSIVGMLTPIISYFVLTKFEIKGLKTDVKQIKDDIKVLSEITLIKNKYATLEQSLSDHEKKQEKDMDELFRMMRSNSENIVKLLERSEKWKL